MALETAQEDMGKRIDWADIGVIIGYFVVSMIVGLWVICKPNQNTIRGYFLAGQSMVWWPVGMSIFASNIGADNFVGMSGTAAASGMAVVMFEWAAVYLLMLLGWVFLPVHCGSGIFTMPQYLQQRFGGERLRLYLCIIALVTYLFTTLAVDLYTGALFIQQAMGWNLYIGVALMLSIAAIYCALGGLSTVIFTDAMAVVIMFIGGSVLTIIGFMKVGGLQGLFSMYQNSVSNYSLHHPNDSCGLPREDALHIVRGFDADIPMLGTLVRTMFGALWFWCANQLLVQRTLAAKNLSHARGGCVFAAYLKILPIFLVVWPGMMSRALFPNEVGCSDPETCTRVCGNPASCSNIAYPKLVVELLPQGARGLVLAVMIAAVVSTLTSLFNSSSTLVSIDLWSKFRPKASSRELLMVSRVCVLVMVVIAVLWIPVMQAAQGGQIYRYSTTIKGYMGTPTSIMFLLAILWHRVTEQGAFWGMVVAQVFGMVRFVLDIVYPEPGCGGHDTRPILVSGLNGYDFTAIQVVVAFLAIIAISLFTKKPHRETFTGLTYWTRFEMTARDRANESAVKLKEVEEDATDPSADPHVLLEGRGGEAEDDPQDKVKCIGCKQWWEGFWGGGSSARATEAREQPYARRMAWLRQSVCHNAILTVNAIAVCLITTFLWGYFA